MVHNIYIVGSPSPWLPRHLTAVVKRGHARTTCTVSDQLQRQARTPAGPTRTAHALYGRRTGWAAPLRPADGNPSRAAARPVLTDGQLTTDSCV